MQLELRGLCAERGGREILHDIALQVETGAFVSLLGPSGCGKSTLLQTIAGILPQTKGTVSIGGAVVDRLPAHKRGIAIVFQDMRLFPHMNAAENVAFPLRMRGVARREALQSAAGLLERVQLGGYGARKPHQLSGGQQQRVALARALAAKPGVLLLDEPFSGLDENLRDDMRGLVRALHEEFAMTSVLVTHDRQEALSLSDKVVLMQEGRILQTGTPRELYLKPGSKEAAAYFGNVRFVEGAVKAGVFTCPLFSMPAARADGRYTAALRPHDVSVRPGRAYRLVRAFYQGAATLAVFRHLSTELEVFALLDAEQSAGIGDTADLAVRTEGCPLFPEG